MNLVRKYLAMCQDESLEEHDRHYHGGNFDPKTMECGKRDNMAKEDEGDADVSSETLSDERKEEAEELLRDKVLGLGSSLSELFVFPIPKRRMTAFSWNGNKFKCKAVGLSEVDVETIKRHNSHTNHYTGEPQESDYERDFALSHFGLKNFNIGKETLRDTGGHYEDDWKARNIKAGDSVKMYELEISGEIQDKQKEYEKNYRRTTDAVFEMAKKALKGSDKYEVERLHGKRQSDSGDSYDVIGITSKRTGLTELTYKIGGTEGKSITRRMAGVGESAISLEDIVQDVMRYGHRGE